MQQPTEDIKVRVWSTKPERNGLTGGEKAWLLLFLVAAPIWAYIRSWSQLPRLLDGDLFISELLTLAVAGLIAVLWVLAAAWALWGTLKGLRTFARWFAREASS